MLLCLPLFLGFAAEAQAQAECVSEDLLDHVEAKIEIKPTDRWVRIKNALTEQSNAMPLSEAKSILANRKANGWNLNRFDDVVAAMECLAKPKPGGLEADDAPQACVSPALAADVKGYSEETWHGSAHVERWLRVLQTFSGTANDSTVMTPAEAQEMADRWSNGRWDPVVDALQCLEVEALNEQTEVQTEEPEDAPQPLNAEETPMPAQSDPVSFTNFRVYLHDATPNPNPGTEYRINEDDYWEAELIVHFETNRSNALDNGLCINHDLWTGNEYWNNGPIQLSGFTEYEDFKSSPTWDSIKGISKKWGYWQCTPNIDTEPPHITILNPRDDGDDNDTSNDDGIIEFIYRGKIRIRDNNVVEDDFDLTDLKFRYSDGLSGSDENVIWRTETDPVVDRAAYRLKRDVVAWTGTWGLGTGSAWTEFTDPTCGQVVPSKWIDRAPKIGNSFDKSHSDYIVRANVDANVWLPDHCYPTDHVPIIPPTPPNHQPTDYDNTSLPIIEEDDVSWVDLHKKNGKWTVSLSKPVMVTDGRDCSADEARQQAELDALIAAEPDARLHTGIRNNFTWNFDHICDKWWMSDKGLVLRVSTRRVVNNNSSSAHVELLIPATNGIVQDVDYGLHNLKTVRSSGVPPKHNNPSSTVQEIGPFSELCEGQFTGVPLQYRDASGEAFGLPTTMLPIDAPPVGTNLCN